MGHGRHDPSAALRCVLVLVVAAVGACGPADDQPAATLAPDRPSASPSPTVAEPGSAVTFRDDFDTDPFDRWEPVTRSAWVWEKTERVFELTTNVPLTESVRAPFNRNLIKAPVVADFQLDVDLRSTTRDYPHRSLCLFFGFRDAAHMYYVHFGQEASKESNQVFIVDGKDRTPISRHTTPGTPWDDDWHHARIVRTVENGSIKVYFDDMTTPVMTASDRTFTSGQVGIGSFDDTGVFDNVVLRGTRG